MEVWGAILIYGLLIFSSYLFSAVENTKVLSRWNEELDVDVDEEIKIKMTNTLNIS